MERKGMKNFWHLISWFLYPLLQRWKPSIPLSMSERYQSMTSRSLETGDGRGAELHSAIFIAIMRPIAIGRNWPGVDDQWRSLNDCFKIDQLFTGNWRLIILDRFSPVYHFCIPFRDAALRRLSCINREQLM